MVSSWLALLQPILELMKTHTKCTIHLLCSNTLFALIPELYMTYTWAVPDRLRISSYVTRHQFPAYSLPISPNLKITHPIHQTGTSAIRYSRVLKRFKALLLNFYCVCLINFKH